MNMMRTLCQIPILVYVLAAVSCIAVSVIVNRSAKWRRRSRLDWSHVVSVICLRSNFRSIVHHRRLAFLNLLILSFFLFQLLTAVITGELVTTIPSTFMSSVNEIAASNRTAVFRAGAGSLDKIKRESGSSYKEMVQRRKQITSQDLYIKYLRALQSNDVVIDSSFFARIAEGLACVTVDLQTKFFDLHLSDKSFLTFSRQVDPRIRERVHRLHQRLLETGSLYFYSNDPVQNVMPDQAWKVSRCEETRKGGKNAPSPPGLQLKTFRVFFYLFALLLAVSCLSHVLSLQQRFCLWLL